MTRKTLHDVLSGRRLTQLGYEQELPKLQHRLLDAQFDLRQTTDRAVVLIVTGIPAAGRSEVVNELLEWLDPKFVTVFGFRAPNASERERPPLWRYWRVMPPKGRILILFAGWYDEILRAAVKLDGKMTAMPAALRRDVERIQQLEKMLVSDHVAIVKVHLHVAPQTQARRLRKLQRDKAMRWRVTVEDRWMARHYSAVERAFERCLQATDQAVAPWHVVDGTDSQHRSLEVGRKLLARIEGVLSQATPAVRHATIKVRLARTALPTGHPGAALADQEYDNELETLRGKLARLSRKRKFAHHAVIGVFEGMDASGKGGAIRRITSALDARQYCVVPISAPTPEESSYPYLWRFWSHMPSRGNYTIFDRSWYGRVLVERVRGFAARADWQRAYDEINEFERQLAEHRVIVVKFWLAVSPEEQLERFSERDRNPLKRFKVDPEDWANRKLWPAYQVAAKEVIARTNTGHAPWTIVPADDKRYARLAVLRTLADRIESTLA